MFADAAALTAMVARLDERRTDIAQLRELLGHELQQLDGTTDLPRRTALAEALVELVAAEDALLRDSKALLALVGRMCVEVRS